MSCDAWLKADSPDEATAWVSKGKASGGSSKTSPHTYSFSDKKNQCSSLEDVDHEISMALKRCAAWPKSVLSFPDLVFVLSQQSYKHRHHQTMVHHLTVLDHPFLKLLS